MNAGQVKTVQLASTSGGTSTGTLTDGKTFTVVVPPQAGQVLLTDLQQHNVEISSAPLGNGFGTEVLIYLITFGLPIVFFIWLFRRISKGAAGGLQGIMGVGRSRAKVFDEEQPSTTFADVAGYEGAKSEIAEVVDFLKKPDRYSRVGASGAPRRPHGRAARHRQDAAGPRGGRRGARAVLLRERVQLRGAVRRGRRVPGPRPVRRGAQARARHHLHRRDRRHRPAPRGRRGRVRANDEREQTLNQLLAEMDGFEPSSGIVVLAATNRPEILDPALLRPGRFDRQVTIPLPNVSERAAILAVHCRGKKLAADVDLNAIARGTPGFSGADLANLVNEAAISAVRDGRDVITAADFDAARDRIILGRREGSNVLLPEEKHAVAVHESGHALVAALSEHADPVAKVTILPAGQTLGVTEQLPLVERHMYGEDYLHDSLAVRLGGRAAELVVIGQGSTGAANDLAGATDLAIKMVREFGLSETLGPIGYPEGGSVFLGGGGPAMSSRPFAEATQAEIDREVSQLLRQAEERATELLKGHRSQLDALVSLLLEMETVNGSDVYRLTGQPDRGATSPPVPPITVAPRAVAASDAGPSRTPLAVPTPVRTDRAERSRVRAPGRFTAPARGAVVSLAAAVCPGRCTLGLWRWRCRRTFPARRSTALTSARWSFTSTP